MNAYQQKWVDVLSNVPIFRAGKLEALGGWISYIDMPHVSDLKTDKG